MTPLAHFNKDPQVCVLKKEIGGNRAGMNLGKISVDYSGF